MLQNQEKNHVLKPLRIKRTVHSFTCEEELLLWSNQQQHFKRKKEEKKNKKTRRKKTGDELFSRKYHHSGKQWKFPIMRECVQRVFHRTKCDLCTNDYLHTSENAVYLMLFTYICFQIFYIYDDFYIFPEHLFIRTINIQFIYFKRNNDHFAKQFMKRNTVNLL